MYRHPCLTHFILISCPLLHSSVTLYTDGLWSLFSKEAGILFTWVSSSRWVFNALDRWLAFTGSTFDEASLRLPRPFFPYINSTSLSFSSISTLLIFWRERPSPILRHLYFRQLIHRCLQSHPEGHHTSKLSSPLSSFFFFFIFASLVRTSV